MTMGRKLRNLMHDHKFLYTPGITTPLHAMMGAFHPFAGFPEIKELEAKYLPAEEVKKKYEQSVGL